MRTYTKIKTVAPKKSLGQNFLTDKTIAQNIVECLGEVENKNILEIGPGMGVLTEILIKKNANLTSVEIDQRAIEYLNQKFKSETGKFQLVQSDILKFDLREYAEQSGEKISIIGNIPYNISSEIFFMMFENAGYIKRAVLTVQKEVARRIAATTKQNKEYGISTLARTMTSSAKIAFEIKPVAFFPAPKVTSAVIILDFFDEQPTVEHYENTMKIVRAAFSQRRKVLRNALSTYIQGKGINIDEFVSYCESQKISYFRRRAEELTLEDYVILYNEIEKFETGK